MKLKSRMKVCGLYSLYVIEEVACTRMTEQKEKRTYGKLLSFVKLQIIFARGFYNSC